MCVIWPRGPPGGAGTCGRREGRPPPDPGSVHRFFFAHTISAGLTETVSFYFDVFLTPGLQISCAPGKTTSRSQREAVCVLAFSEGFITHT